MCVISTPNCFSCKVELYDFIFYTQQELFEIQCTYDDSEQKMRHKRQAVYDPCAAA